MNQKERVEYCLARSQGAKLFSKDDNESQSWYERYLVEKKKLEEVKPNV